MPFGGAAARWFCVLLKGLVEKGHQVTAFSAYGREVEMEQAMRLFPGPGYDLRCYPYSSEEGLQGKLRTLRQPYSYPFSRKLRSDLIAEVERGCDVLHLEQLWSGWTGLSHRQKSVLNIHYLFRIDLANKTRTSMRERMDFSFACQAECSLIKKYRNICTLTSRLSDEVRRINPRAAVHTVPLSLDLDNYPFDATRLLKSEPVVSLIGSFDWEPTFSAAQRLSRLWPAIKQMVPTANLQVVGRRADLVRSLFAYDPGVTIDSDVPHILNYFEKSDLLFYPPASGSGMKVKVIEAFAMGVPVITNADGVEGMSAVDGMHAGIGETDQQLVHRAVALLMNPSKWASQRIEARRLVENELSRSSSLRRVEEMHEIVMANQRAAI